MLQAERLQVKFAIRSLDFSIDLILQPHYGALGSTESLTEMSTRNLPQGKGRLAHKADNLTALWADCLENVGVLTSHNPMSLDGLLQG
jgi:hypothetical protein